MQNLELDILKNVRPKYSDRTHCLPINIGEAEII